MFCFTLKSIPAFLGLVALGFFARHETRRDQNLFTSGTCWSSSSREPVGARKGRGGPIPSGKSCAEGD